MAGMKTPKMTTKIQTVGKPIGPTSTRTMRSSRKGR